MSAPTTRNDGDGVRRALADGTDDAIGEAKATVGLGRVVDTGEEDDEEGATNDTGEGDEGCVVVVVVVGIWDATCDGGARGGECVNRATEVGPGDDMVVTLVLEAAATGENKLTDACAAVGNKGTRAVKSSVQFDTEVVTGGTARVKVAVPSSR